MHTHWHPRLFVCDQKHATGVINTSPVSTLGGAWQLQGVPDEGPTAEGQHSQEASECHDCVPPDALLPVHPHKPA